jgi:hypothetical protein
MLIMDNILWLILVAERLLFLVIAQIGLIWKVHWCPIYLNYLTTLLRVFRVGQTPIIMAMAIM